MRIKNIDILKTIAIAMVILIHFRYDVIAMNPDTSDLHKAIYFILRNFYSCGVILFIVISGYLIIDKKYSYENIFKKIFILYLLTIFYKLVAILIMEGGHFTPSMIGNILFNGAFNGSSLQGDYRTNHLWYIYVYMGILFFQPIMSSIYQDKKKYTIFATFVILVTFIIIFTFNFLQFENITGTAFTASLPLSTKYAHMYALYLLGGLIKMNEEKIVNYFNNLKYRVTKVVTILLFTLGTGSILTYILKFMNKETFSTPAYHYETFYGLVMGVSLFCLFRYCLPEIQNKYIQFISKNSLGIYFIHWPIEYIIKKYSIEIPFFQNVITDSLLSIAILFICAIVIYLFQKNKYLAKLVTI
ncbi:acyltransferase [Erysipelotrichaceae bacterium OttesenSCG-928-M19]|nr:acyltransferase [Erysipelotrichaceae bacterium OttesenSCG-928-M19]